MTAARTGGGVLVGIDLRGIQAYVYSGQRVLDAVGRAAQVEGFVDTGSPDGVGALLGPGTKVLRSAGGALTVDFADEEAAREFVSRYTRHVRERTDDLVPVVALARYGPGREFAGPAEAHQGLPDLLRRARAWQSAAHTPVRGYGITAVCSVSGRPAEVVDPSRGDGAAGERVSADVARARDLGRRWHRRITERLLAGVPAPHGGGWTLPVEVDQMGRDPAGRGRVAVVHLDFNGMGERLAGHGREAADRLGERAAVRAQREVSRAIAALTEGLARELVGAVARAVRVDDRGVPVVRGHGAGGVLALSVADGRIRLPLRPLVVAGDELTLVCDARLAFSLVRHAFRWLDADPRRLPAADVRARLHRAYLALADPGGGQDPLRHADEVLGWARWTGPEEDEYATLVPTLGAGLAVQPVRAPLVLGYRLSAALCAEAKAERARWLAEEGGDDHAVAWTLRADGVERVVRALREAHAVRGSGRPSGQPMSGWEFTDFLDRYLSGDREGSLRRGDAAQRSWIRSELVPLLERDGDLAAERVRRARRGPGPRLLLPAADGGRRARGLLLDAVELLDLHLDVPLERGGTGEEADGRT
mgnify:CR=1 FL=1